MQKMNPLSEDHRNGEIRTLNEIYKKNVKTTTKMLRKIFGLDKKTRPLSKN